MSTWNPPPPPACVRRAWLSLPNGATVYLEGTGWVCQSLDLGYPTAREVINPIPDQDGSDDRTALMGPRVVTANITALTGAGARIDDVADNFGPFMVPSARPVLHYILDRPGAAERTLTLRGSGYAWPIVGAAQRDIQLQWVAADPIVRDPVQKTVTAWSGTGAAGGRQYNLTFNRAYPPGGGTGNTANLSSPGDVGVRPLIRVYGPVTGPALTFQTFTAGGSSATTYFWFLPGYTIAAGAWVDIDAAGRTVYVNSDPTQPALNQVDWSRSSWPYLAPSPAYVLMQLGGTATTGVTQAQAIWNDGYLN